MSPTNRDGKICYLELPAVDAVVSAEFYRRVFGWSIRRRGDGAIAFDDTTGEVGGSWVADRAPAGDSGIVVYVMVADIVAAAKAIEDAGGAIVLRPDPHAEVVFGHFRDPGGNLLGIYSE